MAVSKSIFDPEQYLPGHTCELVPGGESFFERVLQIIREAQKHLQIHVYIFDEDRTGKEVTAALKQARQRGVEVYLLVDAYGSMSLSPAFVADMLQQGIQFRFFSPLPKHFFVFRLGRRLHNKVVVADHLVALVGGINIADKYRGSEGVAPWLDFAIWIKGPMCMELSRNCTRIFREKYFGKLPAPTTSPKHKHFGRTRSRLALNDWLRRKNQVRDGYRAAFKNASQSIIIVASYFLPSRSIRIALKQAAIRGVSVTVLLPGESDVPLAKRATRYLYHWLWKNNIHILEWEKSILHGKLAVVDQKWVTIGSYNLNHLSQYSSIEMNVEVLDNKFATQVHEHLSDILTKSKPVAQNQDSIAGRWQQTLDWGAYLIARWLMRLLYFFVARNGTNRDDP